MTSAVGFELAAEQTAGELARRLRGRRILALSPHPDDLALSLGGTLPHLAAAAELLAVTVFSHSVWVPRREDLAGDRAAIHRLRMAEDRAYFGSLGVPLTILPFDDSGVRGLDAAGERTAELAGDAVADPVRRALRRLLAATRADLVLAPLGLGGHIDHRLVTAAVLESGRRALFYEDLPYAAELSHESASPSAPWAGLEDTLPAAERRASGRALRRRRILLTEADLERKQRGLDAYVSQIRSSDRRAVEVHARITGALAEGLWE